MVKVSKYLKNVSKSLGYAFYEVTKEDYETMAEFGSTNSELFKQAYSDLKNYKTTYQRIMKSFKNSKVFIASKEGLKAIKEDIRTGDFYNKARQDAFTTKYGGNVLNDDDWDIGDFGFDDSSDWEIDDGDQLVAKATTKANKLSSILISDTIVRTSEAQIENSREIASVQYAQNLELTKSINRNIENLGMNIDNRMKDFASMSKVNSDNAIKFYDSVGKSLATIAADVKVIADGERRRQDPNFDKKAKETKRGDDIEDIASGGIVDLREYGKKIKKNLIDTLDRELGGGLNLLLGDGGMEGSNMLASMAEHPLHDLISKPLVNNLLTSQNELRYNLKNLNDTLAGFFPALMARANTMANKDTYDGGKPIWQMLGKIFGIRNKYKTNIETRNFNHGAVSWDGVSKKYLEEVIPYYLRKMTSALTGERERVYDPESGRWVDLSSYRENYAQSEYNRGISAFGEFRAQMNELIKDIRFSGANGYKDQKELQENLDKLFREIYRQGDIDLKDKTGSQMGTSDAALNIFRAALESVDNKTRMQIINNINSQKRQSSENLKRAEEAGGLLYKLASEGINLTKYNPDKYKATKDGLNTHLNEFGELDVKHGKSPLGMAILKIEDKYGNTLFDYLKGFKEEMEYFRKHGTYVYGYVNVTNMGEAGTSNPNPPSSENGNPEIITPNQSNNRRRRKPNYRPRALNIKALTPEEQAEHEKLNMKYGPVAKTGSQKMTESEQSNMDNYNNRTKAMQEDDKKNKKTSATYIDLSAEGGINQTRNHMFERAREQEDKRKKEWLDERNKDSVLKDILGITQDRVYREKHKNDKEDTKFSDKFDQADTIGEKIFLVKTQMQNFFDKPSEMLNKAVLAADNHLYNMLYKSSTGMVDEDGKPIDGFMDLLKFNMSKTFRDIRNDASEFIQNARDKFENSQIGQWWNELKNRMFGEETGKGYRSFLSPLMEKLEENSEAVFKMYKDTVLKTLEQSGALRKDEEGKYTFKTVSQTNQEKFDVYERNAQSSMDAIQILNQYRHNNKTRDLVEKIKNMDDNTKSKMKTMNPETAKIIDQIDAGLKAEKIYGVGGELQKQLEQEGLSDELKEKYRTLIFKDLNTMRDENNMSKAKFDEKLKNQQIKVKETIGDIDNLDKDIAAQNDIINGKDEKGNDKEYTKEEKEQAKKDREELEKQKKEKQEALEKEKAEAARLKNKQKSFYTEFVSEFDSTFNNPQVDINAEGHIFNIIMQDNYLMSIYKNFKNELNSSKDKLKVINKTIKEMTAQKAKYDELRKDLNQTISDIYYDADGRELNEDEEQEVQNLRSHVKALTDTIKILDTNIKVLKEGVDLEGKSRTHITRVEDPMKDSDGNYSVKTGKTESVSNEKALKSRNNLNLKTFNEHGVNIGAEIEKYASDRELVEKIKAKYVDEEGNFDESKLNEQQKKFMSEFAVREKFVKELMAQVKADKEKLKEKDAQLASMKEQLDKRGATEAEANRQIHSITENKKALENQLNGKISKNHAKKLRKRIKEIEAQLDKADTLDDDTIQKLLVEYADAQNLLDNGKTLTAEERENIEKQIRRADEDLQLYNNRFTDTEKRQYAESVAKKEKEIEELKKSSPEVLAFSELSKSLSKPKFADNDKGHKEEREHNEALNKRLKEFEDLGKETKTMARGGINKTGKAFKSVVSSGEYINGVRVPDGGPYLTTIPKGATVINPNKESVIQRQAREEKTFLNSIRRNAETNDGLKQLPAPIQEAADKFGKNFGMDGVARGLIGMGASGLLLGMPLLGAGIGMGSSLIQKNDELNQTLFGTIVGTDEDTGEKIRMNDGLISDTIQKAFPDAKNFGLTGSLLGMLTPFGPLGGLLIGAGLGFAKNTEIVKDELLGVGAPFSEENRAKIKKALPRMGLGALAGVMFGPLGLIPNALLGGAAGFVTTTDKFKDFMFGEEDADGKREGGFVGALKEQVLSPLGNLVKDIGTQIKDTLYNDFLTPIVKLIPTLTNELKHFFTDSLMTIPNLIKDSIEGLKNPIVNFMRDNLLNPIKGFVGKVLGFGVGILKAPFTMVGKAARAVKGSLDRKAIRGGYSKMSAAERNEERRKHKFSFAAHNASIIGKDKYAAFDEGMEHLSNASSIEDLDKLKNALIANRKDSKGLKKSLMKNQEDISKEISSDFSTYFVGGTAKKIEKAIRNKEYAKAKKLIQTSETIHGGRLSKSESNAMISKVDNLISERENMQGKMDNYLNMDDKLITNLAESMGLKGLKAGKMTDKQKKQLISMLDVEITNKKKSKSKLGDQAYSELEENFKQIEAQNKNTIAIKNLTEVLTDVIKDTHKIIGAPDNATGAQARESFGADNETQRFDYATAEIDDEIKGYDSVIERITNQLNNPDISAKDRARLEEELANEKAKRRNAKRRKGYAAKKHKANENFKARQNNIHKYQSKIEEKNDKKFEKKQHDKYVKPLKESGEYSESFDKLELLTDPAYEKHAIVLNTMHKKGHYVRDLDFFLKADDNSLNKFNGVGKLTDLDKRDMEKVIALSPSQVSSLCKFLREDPTVLNKNNLTALFGILSTDEELYKDSDLERVQTPAHSFKSKTKRAINKIGRGFLKGAGAVLDAPDYFHNVRADKKEYAERRKLITEIRNLTIGTSLSRYALTPEQLNNMKINELRVYLDGLKQKEVNPKGSSISENIPNQITDNGEDTIEVEIPQAEMVEEPEEIQTNAFADKMLTPFKKVGNFIKTKSEKRKAKAIEKREAKKREQLNTKRDEVKARIDKENAEKLRTMNEQLRQIVQNTATTAENTSEPEAGSKEEADAKVKEHKIFGVFDTIKEKLTRIAENTEEEEDVSPLKESILTKVAKIFGKVLFFGKIVGGVPLYVGFIHKYVYPFIKDKIIPALIGTKGADGQYEGGIISPIANAIGEKFRAVGEYITEKYGSFKNMITDVLVPKLKDTLIAVGSELWDTWKDGAGLILETTFSRVLPQAMELLMENLPEIVAKGIEGFKKGIWKFFNKDNKVSDNEQNVSTSDTAKANVAMGTYDKENLEKTSQSKIQNKLEESEEKLSNKSSLSKVVAQNNNADAYYATNENAEEAAMRQNYLDETYGEELANNSSWDSVKDSEVAYTNTAVNSGRSVADMVGRYTFNSAVYGKNVGTLALGATRLGARAMSHGPGIIGVAGRATNNLLTGIKKFGDVGVNIHNATKMAALEKKAASGSLKAAKAKMKLEKKLAKEASKKITKEAVEGAGKASTGLIARVKNDIVAFFKKIAGCEVVVEKAAEAAGTVNNPAFRSRFGKAMDKLANAFGKVLGKASVKGLMAAASKLMAIINVVIIAKDFIEGMGNAPTVLGIVAKEDELSASEIFFAGLCNVLSGQLVFFSASKICEFLIKHFNFLGEEAEAEIQRKHEEAEEVINAYNIKNGTNFDNIEDFNAAVNTTRLQKLKNTVNDKIEKYYKNTKIGKKSYDAFVKEREKYEKSGTFGKAFINVKNFVKGVGPGGMNWLEYLQMKKIYEKDKAAQLVNESENMDMDLQDIDLDLDEEEVATNAKANNKLTPIKTALNRSAKGLNNIGKHIKDMITHPIKTIEEEFLDGESIPDKLEKLSNLNNTIRNKIANGKILSADKDYWKINTNNESGFAVSLFKLSEFMQRAIKSPLLIIQNAIDSVLSGETNGTIANNSTSSSNSTNTAATQMTNTSSGNTGTTAKKIGLKSAISIAAGIAGVLAKTFFGKGTGENKSAIKHLKLKYAIPPKPLLDEQVSYIKSQYSGGSNEDGHLYQRDYNDTFNISGDSTTQTIGDSGCGPVVASQLLQRYGKSYDVREAAKAALKYKERDGGTFPEYFDDYLGKHGVSTQNINSKSEVYNKLSKGNPVILMGQSGTGKKTPFGSTNPHYVLATGLSGKNVVVQDPEDPMADALYDAQSTINDSMVAINTNDNGMGRRLGKGLRKSGRGSMLGITSMPDDKEKKLLDLYYEMVLKGESAGSGIYSAVNADDNGSYSVGSIQFHDVLARDMLLKMAERIPDVDDRQFLTSLANKYKSIMSDSDAARYKSIVDKYPQIAKEVQDSEAYRHFTEVNFKKPIQLFNEGRLKNPMSMIVPADITNTGEHNGWADNFVNNTNGGPEEVDAITNHLMYNSWWANPTVESCKKYVKGWQNRIQNTGNMVRNIDLDTYVPGTIMGDAYEGFSGSYSSSNGTNGSNINSSTSNTIFGKITSYVTEGLRKMYGGLYDALFGTVETNDNYSGSPLGQNRDGAYNGLVADETADGWFAATLENSRMSSGYKTPDRPNHSGIDYAAPEGTKIYCPVDGAVVYSQWNDGGYGYLVIVQDTHGYYHIFGHQCKASPLKVNDEVLRGDLIGYVGNTGDSKGNHLHYQVNNSTDMWDASIDPNKYPYYGEYAANAKARKAQYNADTINTINPDANLTADSSSTDMISALQKSKSSSSTQSGSSNNKSVSSKSRKSGRASAMVMNNSMLGDMEEVTANPKYMPGAKSGSNRQNIGGSTITTEMMVAIINLLGNISANTHQLNEVVELLSKLSIANAQTLSASSNKKSGKGEKDTTDDIMKELTKVLAKSKQSNGMNYGLLNSTLNKYNDNSAIESVYQIARR